MRMVRGNEQLRGPERGFLREVAGVVGFEGGAETAVQDEDRRGRAGRIGVSHYA